MVDFRRILSWSLVAAAAFHAAYASAYASPLMVLYLFALLQLAQTDRWRKAFYSGLGVGLLVAALRLAFFWRLFSGGALALWLVYAFWVGLFVALARLCIGPSEPGNMLEIDRGIAERPPTPSLSPSGGERVPFRAGEGSLVSAPRSGETSGVSFRRLGPKWGWLLIPFVWTGLEYFRSELYYLRFSWLNVGYAFAGAPWQEAVGLIGVYGVGFLLAALACVAAYAWDKSRTRAVVMLSLAVAGVCLTGLWTRPEPRVSPVAGVRVAGIQTEFPSENEVLLSLNDTVRAHPDTELVVLSEYTFQGPVPLRVTEWCRQKKRYLIAGGKDPGPGASFYNTAYVIGPNGEVVFRQVKAVPIQFIKDGLPAPAQKLWNSPWGKIGICICYDLSYTRVTDQLVQLGAEALIVPTMDVADWGRAQHELHARIAPVRAAEYGLPIFRLASSGISQIVDRSGRVTAVAPCPGDGARLAGTLEMRGVGHRPLDRWLAPFATGVTALAIVCFSMQWVLGNRRAAAARATGI